MSLTVSDTAYAIATVRAMEAERAEGDRLFDDPYARIFAAAGEHAKEGVQRFLSLPFFLDGIRLRTRYIDDVVGDAIRQGTRQLVLMGAGFDARALRFSAVADSDIEAFEVDFAHLLETKRALLAQSGISLGERVRYVACDFASAYESALAEALEAAGFDRKRPTVFVFEGVGAYLTHDAINRALGFMASMSAPGSALIFDFSDLSLEPDPASARSARAGFKDFGEVGFDEAWRLYLKGEPHPSASFVKFGIASK